MSSLHPGMELDHYRIERLVARSGMASIYQASDLKSSRKVALKIPHPEVEADPLLFDRFKREEAIGKKLDHPAVMKVYDDEERSQIYMVIDLHHRRVVELFTDGFFALEAIEKKRIGLYLRMRGA